MFELKYIVLLFAFNLVVFSITMIISISDAIAATENSCISFDAKEQEISVTCEYANFADIENQLQNQNILYRESSPNNFNDKNWILNVGIRVEEDATLNIDSDGDDITWLKIVPSANKPNAIKVDGSLKVNGVKITSWNPQTKDYVYFSGETKYNDTKYTEEIRPYIKVNSDATGPTIIQNSELAYLGYSCNGCGGVSFNGGEYSILKNNDIHHIYKGFYSKGMGYMLIEGNRVYENEKYGIDPHSRTHHMIIRNNTVYDNYNAGIICSANCSNILIEENKVYNNGHGDNMRGIAVSKNVSNTIIKNNIIYDEDKCISIGRDSFDNIVYNNILLNCQYGVYVTKSSSFNNEIRDNKITNVEYGLVATDESIKNIFHSNTITDVKVDVAAQDKSSIGNAFKNNKKIVSFDTLERK